MEEFKNIDEEVDKTETDLDTTFLVQKCYYKILIENEIKKNYENCLKLAFKAKQTFENETVFNYFIALNQFKLGMESAKNSEELARSYLSDSKNNFEKYSVSQKDKTKKLLNSYFVLGKIHQLEAEYELKNEEIKKRKCFVAADYFKKVIASLNILDKIGNERSEIFESNEYKAKTVRFHYAESLFNIKESKQAEIELIELYKDCLKARENETKTSNSFAFKHLKSLNFLQSIKTINKENIF